MRWEAFDPPKLQGAMSLPPDGARIPGGFLAGTAQARREEALIVLRALLISGLVAMAALGLSYSQSLRSGARAAGVHCVNLGKGAAFCEGANPLDAPIDDCSSFGRGGLVCKTEPNVRR
jgi:hypothetical protein